jgi:CHASE2 domain-containing sensor protein/tRNA A-37 threonylcarbamoyl transferase component Bud32
MNLQFKRINILIAILVAGIFSFLTLRAPAFMEDLEGIPYGIQMRLDLPSASTENKIAIVNIDDKSVSQLGPWPWPRHLLAEMLDILKDNGVKLVGLDMTLDHEEPNPGLHEIRGLREQVSARAGLQDGSALSDWLMERLREIEGRLDDDRRLAETIRRCGNVILGAIGTFGPYDTDLVLPAQSFLRKSALHSFQVGKNLNMDFDVNSLSTPIPELSTQCLGIGHLNIHPNDLMAGKTHIPLVDFRSFVIPSMPLRIASEYLASFPEGISVNGQGITVGTKTIPVNDGAVFIKFKGTGRSFPHYSFVDILDVKKVPDVFEDKIVLIGLTARDKGTVQTPVDTAMSNVEFNANVIEDIMTERYLRRPAVMAFLEILLMGLLVLFSALTMGQMNFFTRTTVLGMMVLTVFLMSLILFVAFGIWFKTAYVSLSLVTVYLVFSGKGIVAGERSMERSMEETAEMNRMLGLSLQSQGLLELAFEKLRKCPLDESMKDILYNLGLDFERKRMLNKAISVYEHILNEQVTYRDLEDRLQRLQKLTAELPLGIRKGSTGGQKPILTEGLTTKPTVGRYEILRELGQGAMGVVYEARDPKINRKIAIKTIRLLDEFEEDKVREVKERLFSEAQLAGKLSHPSIVSVYDVGEDYDLTYIAMELLEGKDLEPFCQKDSLLPLRRVLDIVAETADALDYAHAQGVVHRDVKPANIMILNDGRIKVMDFGIAKAVSSSHTKTCVILGTPNYMSPEQIEGHEIDGRSDIFSLGVVLFQLLTGALPFQGKTMTELFYQITQVKHPSPRSVNPRVIKPCEQLIDKALAKNKDKRFQTAGVLAKYLKLLGTKIDAVS